MFMIVKKYKTMLNMLFDKESYDPETNFNLMQVKLSNVKKDQPDCFKCENVTESMKGCLQKLFSCNCCDCETSEYDEDDSEEIELEIMRKKEKRKERKRKQREREMQDEENN